MKIDAHQHYWQSARGDYDWMPDDDPTLSRTYFPADLPAEEIRLSLDTGTRLRYKR